MKIAGHDIQKEVYIIAEISANHVGSFDVAKEMIKAAKEAGANAVKLQTYTADTMTLNCENEIFTLSHGTIWDGQSYYKLYQQAYTPWDWQPKLKKYADGIDITLFSTPFDKTAVDFLEKMSVQVYKIASFEAIDIPLIEYAASKGKPIIISTGICDKQEIQDAVDACKRDGNNDVVLLKCTSAYPAKSEDMNLRTMVDMENEFEVTIGLSDHTMENEGVIASVALGARVIEKHFILDRDMAGPDAVFSLNIEEFANMVKAVRNTEKLLGEITYELDEKKMKNRRSARSLFIAKDIKAGGIFTEENVRSVRPCVGIVPKHMKDVLGKKARIDIKFGTPLSFDMVELA